MATDLTTIDQAAPAATPSRWRRWRWFLAVGVVLVAVTGLALTAGTGANGGRNRVSVEGEAPAFDLPRVGQPAERVTLAQFAGRPLVVNFWASWCVPCREEMPALQAVVDRLAGRVGFVGVNHQDGADAAADFERQVGVTYPSGRDSDGGVARAYGVLGLPTTVLVDPRGRIVARRLGEVNEAELLALLQEAFGRAVTEGAR